jgi:hypothetical protein
MHCGKDLIYQKRLRSYSFITPKQLKQRSENHHQRNAITDSSTFRSFGHNNTLQMSSVRYIMSSIKCNTFFCTLSFLYHSQIALIADVIVIMADSIIKHIHYYRNQLIILHQHRILSFIIQSQ